MTTQQRAGVQKLKAIYSEHADNVEASILDQKVHIRVRIDTSERMFYTGGIFFIDPDGETTVVKVDDLYSGDKLIEELRTVHGFKTKN